jgi:flagellar basal-body rod protein FlgB
MSARGIESLTIPALSLALDAALARQKVIASNIANANVEGFQARRVTFGAVLDTASGAVDQPPGVSGPRTQLLPRLSLSVGGAVRLDQEVAAMAQNSAHFQALLKGLNSHLSVLEIAVRDGRR